MKDSKLPPIGGWAPGGYLCVCLDCNAQFAGDKRATQCADCAYAKKPFQRERDIRAGKMDAERPSFEEITGWFGRVPKTWLPGLLIRIVEISERNKVFKEGGLEKTVARIVEDCKKPMGLRSAQPPQQPAGGGK